MPRLRHKCICTTSSMPSRSPQCPIHIGVGRLASPHLHPASERLSQSSECGCCLVVVGLDDGMVIHPNTKKKNIGNGVVVVVVVVGGGGGGGGEGDYH